MKKYRVYGKYISYGHIDVYADSKGGAYEKAEELSTDEWIVDEDGYWETEECKEVE